MGDGVLAYFGYPQAHEDDEERSVRAGLAVVEVVRGVEAPQSLQVRIGLATGLAVVGDLIGSGAAREEAVIGETPNRPVRFVGECARSHPHGNPINRGDLGSRHAVFRPDADARKLRARDLRRHLLLRVGRRFILLAAQRRRPQGCVAQKKEAAFASSILSGLAFLGFLNYR
jgi:hypothetical protein